MRGGLAAQIAMYVTLVAVVVCAILAVGTIGFAGASFSQLMVDHGETVATAQQMFRDSVAGVFAVALVFALAAGAVLAVAVGRRVGAPLREISVAARLVAQGDHDVRVRESGPAEVRSLARSFNRMAEEIEAQERMRREFVSNAAHELRTPLTNLQGYLEALRDGVVSPERTTFESLHEEVDRLVRLSRSLDALAEGDVGARPGALAVIDLRAAILATVELHTASFERRALRVDTQLPSALAARADADNVAQVLTNLLQNAVRYTPEGGGVTISARERSDDVLVTVTNTGPGIPSGDLPHVFERFYRVEKSRDRASGGAGIGLAIVKALVELGGGHVGVESDAHSTRFWFSVPRAAAS